MFKGSMVALITPMLESGAIDFSSLSRLVDFHLENKTDALVIVGTTGESATLSAKEQVEIIKAVVAQVQGQIPVIAGTAAQSTQQAILNTQQAQALGVDGALIMTPAYIKAPQRGLLAHYQAIAEQTMLPIILYNVPSRTACDLSVETVAQLAQHNNIIAIKEASGSIERCQAILNATKEQNFSVLSGEDSLTLEMIKLGAVGAISVTANIAPAVMQRFCQAALEGDWSEAAVLDKRLQPLHQALFLEANPIPCKWLLSEMGLSKPDLRSPLCCLDERYHTQLRNLFLKFEEYRS